MRVREIYSRAQILPLTFSFLFSFLLLFSVFVKRRIKREERSLASLAIWASSSPVPPVAQGPAGLCLTNPNLASPDPLSPLRFLLAPPGDPHARSPRSFPSRSATRTHAQGCARSPSLPPHALFLAPPDTERLLLAASHVPCRNSAGRSFLASASSPTAQAGVSTPAPWTRDPPRPPAFVLVRAQRSTPTELHRAPAPSSASRPWSSLFVRRDTKPAGLPCIAEPRSPSSCFAGGEDQRRPHALRSRQDSPSPLIEFLAEPRSPVSRSRPDPEDPVACCRLLTGFRELLLAWTAALPRRRLPCTVASLDRRDRLGLRQVQGRPVRFRCFIPVESSRPSVRLRVQLHGDASSTSTASTGSPRTRTSTTRQVPLRIAKFIYHVYHYRRPSKTPWTPNIHGT